MHLLDMSNRFQQLQASKEPLLCDQSAEQQHRQSWSAVVHQNFLEILQYVLTKYLWTRAFKQTSHTKVATYTQV